MKCPHCQSELPEASTFCAQCGRRIEGWRGEVKAEKAGPLPGGEEPTRHVEPTPSLLRAAAVSTKKEKAPTTDAAMEAVKVRRWPVYLGLVVVALSAAAVTYQVARPDDPQPPPSLALPELETPTPVAIAPVTATKKKKPRRIEPISMTEKADKPVAVPKDKGGALPHKKVSTDSKPMTTTSNIPIGKSIPIEELAREAEPLTEEEQKRQAEASVDADGVRWVVRQHMSQVRACQERAFKNGTTGGQVEIGFAIDANGRAQRVRTESNTTDSDLIGKCLESRLREWEFPRPVGGEVELIYPFVFSSR